MASLEQCNGRTASLHKTAGNRTSTRFCMIVGTRSELRVSVVTPSVREPVAAEQAETVSIQFAAIVFPRHRPKNKFASRVMLR